MRCGGTSRDCFWRGLGLELLPLNCNIAVLEVPRKMLWDPPMIIKFQEVDLPSCY